MHITIHTAILSMYVCMTPWLSGKKWYMNIFAKKDQYPRVMKNLTKSSNTFTKMCHNGGFEIEQRTPNALLIQPPTLT